MVTVVDRASSLDSEVLLLTRIPVNDGFSMRVELEVDIKDSGMGDSITM